MARGGACGSVGGGGGSTRPHHPRGAVMRAVAQRDAMPLVDGAAPNVQWQWMGPGNIGGRLRGLVIHPTQPEIMWAGTAGGGVWKTVNGGGTWQPMNSVLSMLAVTKRRASG